MQGDKKKIVFEEPQELIERLLKLENQIEESLMKYDGWVKITRSPITGVTSIYFRDEEKAWESTALLKAAGFKVMEKQTLRKKFLKSRIPNLILEQGAIRRFFKSCPNKRWKELYLQNPI